MKITLPVTWEEYGTIDVEAVSIRNAINSFSQITHELPDESHYVDGSLRLSENALELAIVLNPDIT